MPSAAHGLLICFRLMLACVIAAALPVSHVLWGNDPVNAGVDGPVAFAFEVLFAAIGVGSALTFLVLATFAHRLLRQRARLVPWIDASIGLTLITVLIVAGVTATYSSVP